MRASDDVTAFCEDSHRDLARALWLYCGDADLAVELAQETLYLVCKRWSKVRAARSPRAYAHRMAINVANSHFRRLRAARRADDRSRGHHDTVSLDADGAEAVAVRRAVASLPERQRRAVVLRYYADLPLEEIGDALGVTTGAVKSMLHRANVAMQQALSADDHEGADHV